MSESVTTEFLNQWDVANVFSSADRGLIQEFLEKFAEAVRADMQRDVISMKEKIDV